MRAGFGALAGNEEESCQIKSRSRNGFRLSGPLPPRAPLAPRPIHRTRRRPGAAVVCGAWRGCLRQRRAPWEAGGPFSGFFHLSRRRVWRGAECCALVDEEARRTALNGGRGATVTFSNADTPWRTAAKRCGAAEKESTRAAFQSSTSTRVHWPGLRRPGSAWCPPFGGVCRESGRAHPCD